jgi:hypothetical protein
MGVRVSESSHTRIINSIARDTLRPLGLVRKGRSRTWFDDHGWWVTVIAFEPSGFGKAVVLKVAAMWLWHDLRPGSIAFSLGRQRWGWIDVPGANAWYESDAQFEPEMRRIAIVAAAEVEQFRASIRGYDDCAEACDASQDVNRMLDAAIAWGLAGKKRKAVAALNRHDERMRYYMKRDEDATWMSDSLRAGHRQRPRTRQRAACRSEACVAPRFPSTRLRR